MTNFNFKSYIPKQDIKVRPNTLVEEVFKLFNKEIKDNSFEDITSKIRLNYITYFYKEIKQLFVDYNFWKTVCSYDFCCYQFRSPKDKKDEGNICGRRINHKSNYDSKSNKFLCAEHDRNHRKNYSKPIEKKNNEKYCNHINRDGTSCKYTCKINGLCTKHYKYIYKINKEEIYNKILFYKEYTDINLELNLFNNIEIEKNVHNDVDIKKKVYKKVNLEKFESTQVREVDNNINRPTISTYISNAYSKLEELNNITHNSNIFEKLIEINKLNYHRECEADDCANSKDYNIIYNKYCKKHIVDRPKQTRINFFNQDKYNSQSTTSIAPISNNYNNS